MLYGTQPFCTNAQFFFLNRIQPQDITTKQMYVNTTPKREERRRCSYSVTTFKSATARWGVAISDLGGGRNVEVRMFCWNAWNRTLCVVCLMQCMKQIPRLLNHGVHKSIASIIRFGISSNECFAPGSYYFLPLINS